MDSVSGSPFGRPGADDQSGGFRDASASPYGGRSESDQHGPGGFGVVEAQPPGVAPQSPSRASGRAAVGRVTPPPPNQAPPGQIPGQPIGPDQQGPGQPGQQLPPDYYGEHTTDISRRGQSDEPYVPAPALPTLHARPPLENGFPPPPDSGESPDRMRMGGVFPGPASRGTVTPPNPDETTSWPRQGELEHSQSGIEPEQGRFDQFKPEAAAPATPASPHVRMVPVILGVIIGAALLVGLAIGIVWLISRGSDSGGISVSAGECVKRSGTEAVKATCGDPGTFQVASIADSKDKCADPTQPYVVNPTQNGRTQVLCLKPSS